MSEKNNLADEYYDDRDVMFYNEELYYCGDDSFEEEVVKRKLPDGTVIQYYKGDYDSADFDDFDF